MLYHETSSVYEFPTELDVDGLESLLGYSFGKPEKLSIFVKSWDQEFMNCVVLFYASS